ncbi:MAG: ATP-binding protein [Chthoniobacter sp.]
MRADEGKLRQIFTNLIGNAVKFTERGGVTVRFEALPGAGRTLRLRGEVADTGPGIAAAELPRLFREFEQTESGVRTGGGTRAGPGHQPAVCPLMGGDIRVESEPGRGTLFSFEAPVERGEATALRPGPTRGGCCVCSHRTKGCAS